jgi:hypothetical protein
MACPWFYPQKRLGASASILPLGDAWDGECRAPGAEAGVNDRGTLVRCCNMGYAGASCARFRASGPDAVRFAVVSDSGGLVSLSCITEKAYLPFGRAALAYDARAEVFTVPHPDPNIGRQAWAYVNSYISRKQNS